MSFKLLKSSVRKMALGLSCQTKFLLATTLTKRHITSHKKLSQSERRFLILDLSTEGSLGDDAMIIGSILYLKEKGYKHIGVLSAHGRSDWNGYPESLKEGIELKFLNVDSNWGKGDLYLEFLGIAKNYTDFLVPGADIMDGYYSQISPLVKLRLARLADAVGMQCSILGFSFNNAPHESSVALFKALNKNINVCLRDPYSKGRFEQYTGREVNLVADLAFLLKPSLSSSKLSSKIEWIEKRKQEGRIIIGINANRLLAQKLGKTTPLELATMFADIVEKLFHQRNDLAFVLIPHDYRADSTFPSDNGLASLIHDKVSGNLQELCLTFPEFKLRAPDIKYICKHLDFVVTSRMHLAIACLGVCTPVLGIAYQNKFEGLYSYFEVEELVTCPENFSDASCSTEQILEKVNKLDKFSEKIAHNLPKVQLLAENNFSFLT